MDKTADVENEIVTDKDRFFLNECILDEMFERNLRWLEKNAFIHDPLLLSPETDGRRCIALVARGHVQLHADFKTMIIDMHKHCACAHDHWTTPTLHHTFLVMRGWQPDPSHEDLKVSDDDLVTLEECIQEHLKPYAVIFDSVIPVRTGIVLCGTPGANVNRVRQKLRDINLIQGEPYELDICHVSILRWTEHVPKYMQNRIMDWVQNKVSKTPYITMLVNAIDVVNASWTMHPANAVTIKTIKLD